MKINLNLKVKELLSQITETNNFNSSNISSEINNIKNYIQ